MSLVRAFRTRLQRAWLLAPLLGIVAGWMISKIVVTRTMPNASPEGALFAQTVVLTALYGIVAWRCAVIASQRRRAGSSDLSVQPALVSVDRRNRVNGRVTVRLDDASVTAPVRRHLALVPKQPD